MMGCHLTAPPTEPLLRLEFHPNLTALVEAEVSFVALAPAAKIPDALYLAMDP
jgi:hypothetical protein